MKLDAFESTRVRGAEVLHAVKIELPLAQVVAKSIASWTAPYGASPLLPFTEPDESQVWSFKFVTEEQRVESAHGVVLVGEPSDAVEFTMKALLPEGDSPLAKLKRSLGEDADEDRVRDRLFPASPYETVAMEGTMVGPQHGPVIARESLVLRDYVAQDARLFTLRRAARVLLRCARDTFVGGVKVPGSTLVSVPGSSGGSVVYWDGRRLSCVHALDELPGNVRARLDESGEAFVDVSGALVGPTDLEPTFIVRVPAKLLLSCALGRLPVQPPEPPHAALSSPAYVFDSRTTVPLLRHDGSEPPVLLDEESVCYVLAHLVRRGALFVPGVAVPSRQEPVSVQQVYRRRPYRMAPSVEAFSRRPWQRRPEPYLWLVGARPVVR